MRRNELKLSDILELYRTLERDSRELRDTLLKIPDNREYSEGIRNSIGVELEKLDAIQNEILTLPIFLETPEEHPPKAERVQNVPGPSYTSPEIITTVRPVPPKEPTKNKTPRRY